MHAAHRGNFVVFPVAMFALPRLRMLLMLAAVASEHVGGAKRGTVACHEWMNQCRTMSQLLLLVVWHS
jgi:hypothetical protein